MHLELTVREGSDLNELRELISLLRSHLHDRLTVFEVPSSLDIPFPFPLLTVEEDEFEERTFGEDAVARLRDLAKKAA